MPATDALRQAIERRGRAIFDRATQITKDALRDAAPVGESGDTKGQVDVRPLGGGTVLAAEAVAPAKGGEFVEEGTRAHVIRPRRAGGVLVFESGGETVYARVVHHPGTTAKPWFRPTVDRWERFLDQAARETS